MPAMYMNICLKRGESSSKIARFAVKQADAVASAATRLSWAAMRIPQNDPIEMPEMPIREASTSGCSTSQSMTADPARS